MTSIPNEIFELEVVTDNPLFQGFAFQESADDMPSLLGRESFDDDITPGYERTDTNRVWKPASLSKVWKPVEVEGRVSAFQDFPGVDMVFPAFSRRACDVLRDLLEPNGELLPLVSNVGEYFFYNITQVVDILDYPNSISDLLFERPGTTEPIEYFAFQEKRMKGLSIFRLQELPMWTLVSNEFVERVYTHGLNGFHFTKLWPFPPGVKWEKEARKKEAANRKQLKEMAAQVLVILFLLDGKKPSAKEKKRISQIENDLDAQLIVSSLAAPFFGTYEGSDTVDNQYRMFVTCPDVERLASKLMPWLESVRQSDEIVVFQRFGDLHDPDAPEKMLEFS
ncbi:MAG: DUF1629 domain-containing protein [Planctomycetota bacterium]